MLSAIKLNLRNVMLACYFLAAMTIIAYGYT